MRKIIIIALLAIILLVGAAVYYFYFVPAKNNNVNGSNLNENENINVNLNTNTATNENQNTNLAVKNDETVINENCLVFAERYGSYSNNNNFQSFIDLKSWMTASFQKEIDEFVVSEQEKAKTAPYFAVYTKVISKNIIGLTLQKANCSVVCQRTERNETTETASYFQNLLLQFSKEGEAWLVDQATWQEKINPQ